MPREIERKFLVDQEKLILPDKGNVIKQGYIETRSNTAVRIRVAGQKAFLTIKGANTGATRAEFEYSIPLDDGLEMLNTLCLRPFIEKTRYVLKVDKHDWEVDIFTGENTGLCIAEIELQDENEAFTVPAWAGNEVTSDPRYYNANLMNSPFSHWPKESV